MVSTRYRTSWRRLRIGQCPTAFGTLRSLAWPPIIEGFVKGFATIAEPLTRLTRKMARFEWTEEAQQAFDALEKALAEATSLAFPLPQETCILDTDASDVAVGAVLSQKVDGEERHIAFFSRVMNSTQRNYCTTRSKLLAVISTLQHFRHYLFGNKVVLRTDHHRLQWLHTFKRPEGILPDGWRPWPSLISSFGTDPADCIVMLMGFQGHFVNNVWTK